MSSKNRLRDPKEFLTNTIYNLMADGLSAAAATEIANQLEGVQQQFKRRKTNDETQKSQVIHVGSGPVAVPPPIKKHKRNLVTRRYIDYAENYHQTKVAYLGYADYNRTELIECLAETMLRKIAIRCGSAFTTYDSQSLAFPRNKLHLGANRVRENVTELYFLFRRDTVTTNQFATGIDTVGPVDTVSDSANLSVFHFGLFDKDYREVAGAGYVSGANSSYVDWHDALVMPEITLATLVSKLAYEVSKRAQEGFFVDQIIGFERDTGHSLHQNFSMKDVGASEMNIRVRQNIRIQNVTPAQKPNTAEGDGYNKNDITHNPLDGKCYRFKHTTPRFRRQYREVLQDKALDSMTALEVPSDDGKLNTKVLRLGDSFTAEYHRPEFRSPPTTTNIFSNSSGTSNVYCAPGNFLVLNTMFYYKSTMKRLLLGISQSNMLSGTVSQKSLPTVGDSYMFALRNAVRGEDNSVVELVCNRRCSYMVDYEPAKIRNITVPFRKQEAAVSYGF